MPIVAFLVTVACISPFPDGAHVGRWAVLSIGIPILLLRQGAIWPLLFLAWPAASLIWSPEPWTGLDQLWHFGLLAGVVATVVELRPVLIAIGVGLAVNSCVVIHQLAGGVPVSQVDPNQAAGLFFNVNAQAEFVAMAVVGLVAMRTRLSLALVAVAAIPLFVPPVPRGAWVAIAAAACLALPRWGRLVIVAAIPVAVLLLITPERLPAIGERWAIWMDAAEGLTFLGAGLGGFVHAFPQREYAHNDALQIAYDLGIPGLVAFGALVAWCLWRGAGASRAVMVAFVVEGCFSFPLYQPATAFLAACAAGAALRHRLADRERPGHAGQAAARSAVRGPAALPSGGNDLPAAARFS